MLGQAVPGIEAGAFAGRDAIATLDALNRDGDLCHEVVRRVLLAPLDRCVLDGLPLRVGLELHEEVEAGLTLSEVVTERVGEVRLGPGRRLLAASL